jgi:site-specific DNA recombinase
MGTFDTMSANVIELETSKLRRPEAEREQMKRDLKEMERKQKNIIQQISDRDAEDRPRLAAYDDTLDELETQRLPLQRISPPSLHPSPT